MYRSRINEVFQKECTTKLSCAGVRRAILFKENGLVNVHYLVNLDGTARPIDEMCQAAQQTMYAKTVFRETAHDLEERGKEWREAEQYVDSLVLSTEKKAALDRIYASDASKSAVAFRKALMESKDLKVCGIHFFHWDGTCRDVNSIYVALATIPSFKKGINKFVAAMVVAGAGLYVAAEVLERREKRKNAK